MIITKDIQQEMFREFETPPHVQRHCDAVAEVGYRIARKLAECGYDIDADLVRSSGWVHDLLRLEKDHDIMVARLLEDRGYQDEARVVGNHMKYYPFNDIDHLTEEDILCIADRLVVEDEYVGADARTEYLLAKPNMTEEAAVWVKNAMSEMKDLIAEIEARIGITFDELLQ